MHSTLIFLSIGGAFILRLGVEAVAECLAEEGLKHAAHVVIKRAVIITIRRTVRRTVLKILGRTIYSHTTTDTEADSTTVLEPVTD